jgi:hypothetical protein
MTWLIDMVRTIGTTPQSNDLVKLRFLTLVMACVLEPEHGFFVDSFQRFAREQGPGVSSSAPFFVACHHLVSEYVLRAPAHM